MLDVLQSGPVPPNPAELLQSPRLEELFTQLNELYDYIIVDTSPIGLVADTFSLNRIANAVIFIARQDVTPKEYIKHIHEIVQAERLTNLAIVLNGVDFNAGYGYRYKGYGYGGYGDKKNKK
jgi:Mrp family chromosome partitioning ATPase